MKKILLFSMVIGSTMAVDNPVYYANDMFRYAFGDDGDVISKATQKLLKRCNQNSASYDKKACKQGKALFDNGAKACSKKASIEGNLWYIGYGRSSYMQELKRDLINRG